MDVADIQNLSYVASDLAQAATRAGCDLKFRLLTELDNSSKLGAEQLEEQRNFERGVGGTAVVRMA